MLKARAEEFVGDTVLPENFTMVLDPDYTFTNAYGLRWDAPSETAYPSAFVIDRDGTIRFARVSTSHGGRAGADEILKALQGLDALNHAANGSAPTRSRPSLPESPEELPRRRLDDGAPTHFASRKTTDRLSRLEVTPPRARASRCGPVVRG